MAQPDYESDSQIQEIQDEMYTQEETRQDNAWTKLSPQTRFVIAIGFGIILLLAILGKITVQDALLFSAIGIIIIWLMTSGDNKRTELTWLECMIRIYDLLDFLQKHPIGSFHQVPRGEVQVHPVGRKQWYEGKAFKRSFRVDIFNQELDITTMYFVEVDVFTGDIITFRESPQGVYGDETKDIKLMPSTDMIIQKRRDQWMTPKKPDK